MDSSLKMNAAIVTKNKELADLDADISKLASLTDQEVKMVTVRGSAYEGSVIEINNMKYMLPAQVTRVYFKLKGNFSLSICST